MGKNREAKVTSTVEGRWYQLGGSGYDGIHATPAQFYTELTRALFTKTEDDFSDVRKILQRRLKEIAVLNREMYEIQRMLACSCKAYLGESQSATAKIA